MTPPILSTERLTLRGWQPEDLDAFAELNANRDFVRFIGEGEPIDRSTSWRVMAMLVGHWQLRGYGLWLVEETATGAFVGRVGLWYPDGWPGIELGWGIHPRFQGKGYATEAAAAARDWGFQTLELDRLISTIHPENQRSIRVAERLGGSFSHEEAVNGKLSLIYQVNAENKAD